MPIYAYDRLPEVSSSTSVALRAMMAFAEVDPDEEYMERWFLRDTPDIEGCWYTYKATPREIIEHYIEDVPKVDGHPMWCQPCEGYNVLGKWYDCDLRHQYNHRWLWGLEPHV